MARRSDVTLVAYDIAPSRALAALEDELESRGERVHAILMDGSKRDAPSPYSWQEVMDRSIRASRAVVCGISSQPHCALEMNAATLALDRHATPLFYFADTFGAWDREQVRAFRDNAQAFVVNEAEARRARTSFPRGAHATGNPLWEDDYRSGDRASARAALGLKESDFAILVSMTKTTAVNLALARDAIDAAASVLAYAYVPVLLLACHPRDETVDGIYAPLLKFGNAAGIRTEYLVGGELGVEGCDALMHSGPASLARRAACLGIPVVDHTQGAFMQQWLHQEISAAHTPLADGGGAFESGSSITLGQHFRDLIESRLGLDVPRAHVDQKRAAAQRVYPRLTKGEAARRMADIILA